MANSTNVRFLLSSNKANLATGLEAYAKTATVEAEYGEDVVTGSVQTLAHHGPRQGQLCPCLYPNGNPEAIEVVGLSHIDLDTLGGCAALLGIKPDADSFWHLTALMDTKGVHKLAEFNASPADVRRLNAFFAWNQEHRVFPPRDGSVLDVTEQVLEGINALALVLSNNEELLAAGDRFAANEAALNAQSFVRREGNVIVRKADVFTNHLYTTPDGYVAKAVVARNLKTGGITVSLADPIPGVSCRAILQSLWTESGGHDGIAGSPRGQVMTDDDLELAVKRTKVLLGLPR